MTDEERKKLVAECERADELLRLREENRRLVALIERADWLLEREGHKALFGLRKELRAAIEGSK